MYVFDLMSRESLFKILCDIVQFLHANIKGFIQFDMFSLEVFSIFSGMKQGSVLAPPSIFAVIKINYEHQVFRVCILSTLCFPAVRSKASNLHKNGTSQLETQPRSLNFCPDTQPLHHAGSDTLHAQNEDCKRPAV